MHHGIMLPPRHHRQGPAPGRASAVPVLRGSGTCPLMERVGLGGALKHGAQTKPPSSCPVFWATRTMSWCGNSERVSGIRQVPIKSPWVGQSAGDDDTGAPRATAEGLIFNTILYRWREPKPLQELEPRVKKRKRVRWNCHGRGRLTKKHGEICYHFWQNRLNSIKRNVTFSHI